MTLESQKSEKGRKFELSNGKTLEFYEFKAEPGSEPKYAFRIKNAENEIEQETTDQLLNATKKHRVSYDYIESYAAKLKEMIRKNNLDPILTGDEITRHYDEFRKKFGFLPEFKFDSDSSLVPTFTAKITNSSLADQDFSGTGRRKACAKVHAMQAALAAQSADEHDQHETTQNAH